MIHRDLSNNTFESSEAPAWFTKLPSLTTLWVFQLTVSNYVLFIGCCSSRLTYFWSSEWLNMEDFKDKCRRNFSVFHSCRMCEYSLHNRRKLVLKNTKKIFLPLPICRILDNNKFNGTLDMGDSISQQLQTVNFQNNRLTSVTLTSNYNSTLMWENNSSYHSNITTKVHQCSQNTRFLQTCWKSCLWCSTRKFYLLSSATTTGIDTVFHQSHTMWPQIMPSQSESQPLELQLCLSLWRSDGFQSTVLSRCDK